MQIHTTKAFRFALSASLLLVSLWTGPGWRCAGAEPSPMHDRFATTVQPFLRQYCFECHGPEEQEADRRFDQLPWNFDDETLVSWQEILDQLNLGNMPPSDADQPVDSVRQQIIDGLTDHLRRAAEQQSDTQSATVLRRLNRVEYHNTVRDLFQLQMGSFQPTEHFPDDESVDGFDNIGSALVMSDYLLSRYLQAADALVEKAIFPSDRPAVKTYKFQPPFDLLRAKAVGAEAQLWQALQQPQPFQSIWQGTASKARYVYRSIDAFAEGVPSDGYYRIRVKAAGVGRLHPYGDELIGTDRNEPIRLSLIAGSARYGPLNERQSVDRHLATFSLPDDDPRWMECYVWLDQGFQPRMIYPNGPYIATRLRGPLAERHPDLLDTSLDWRGGPGWVNLVKHYQGPRVRIYAVEIEGPHFEQWPPASHTSVFGSQSVESVDTRRMMQRFARRAFRKPVDSAELDTLLQLVHQHRARGESKLAAIKVGLKAMLCSPHFLYREENAGALNQHALANRLSYFLWSSMPDETLMRLADEGKLNDREQWRRQVERMLDDRRADALPANFTDRWLQLSRLGEMPPDNSLFREYYTQNLEQAMRTETRRFFQFVLKNNLSVARFLDADFTFVNRALAQHYQIDPSAFEPEDGDEHFVRVHLPDRRRGGLLGQASVLTVSANGVDTSPVVRGIWILENLLGTPPAPPPPDVEPLEPDIRGALTIREQLKKHRENSACFACHRKIDPYGFALENFDAIGGWRDSYDRGGRLVVDPSGQLPDGRRFSNVEDLKGLLLDRQDLFARCLVEKMLTYATGRTLTPKDHPHVDMIVTKLESTGYGLRDLVLEVADSPLFRTK